MNIARVIDGTVVMYPYPLRPDAKREYPDVSPLPGAWVQCTPEQMAALDAVEVLATTRPQLQPGESVSEGVPEFSGGAWRQTWVVAPAPPEPVPQSVTSHKIKIMLTQLGWRAEVEAAVAQASDSVRDAWTAPYMNRDSVLLNGIAQMLGKTQAQVDQLFIAADALQT